MSESNGTTPRVCGDCSHWQALPRDPRNLGAPIIGLCIEGPPSLTSLPDGRGGTMALVNYPQLPEGFMACHRFAARKALAVVEGER